MFEDVWGLVWREMFKEACEKMTWLGFHKGIVKLVYLIDKFVYRYLNTAMDGTGFT